MPRGILHHSFELMMNSMLHIVMVMVMVSAEEE